MGSTLTRQAAELLLAALLGIAAGLLYDLLRPPRRALGQPWALLSDLAYGVCAWIGLFLYAMSAGDGRLGVWALSAALLGFLAYLHWLSPLLLPLFTGAAAAIAKALEMLGNRRKIFWEKRKKSFQKWKDCYMMKRNDAHEKRGADKAARDAAAHRGDGAAAVRAGAFHSGAAAPYTDRGAGGVADG